MASTEPLGPTRTSRYTVPTQEAATCERIYHAVAAVFAEIGADATFGWQLPALLTAAGLEDVGAEVHAPLVSGDSPDGWVPLSFEHLLPRVRGAGLLAEAEFEPAFLADQKGRYLPPFMVTAWGQRAPG
ncbi:MAG TPA: hypothetical protein VFB50_11765 [Chloroflexota bacterium]|nr:hypothetical protein [Chloroflexota bacterium]